MAVGTKSSARRILPTAGSSSLVRTASEGNNATFIVLASDKGDRLDTFLESKVGDRSRSQIKKLIASGDILVNQKKVKAGYSLKINDQITAQIPDLVDDTPTAQDMPLDILFEDKDIVVINKASGLSVHPGSGRTENTLVNALLHHCKDLSGIGGVKRPGIVHRLDKDTSGVIVIAKNDAAHQSLSKQFKERTVKKVYAAVVKGEPRHDEGVVDLPIGRHPSDRKKMQVMPPGKARIAITRYEVKQRRNSSSLIYCYPETGRTHQIRVHLLSLGHPILGDVIYNPKSSANRLMLHALKLTFEHPRTKKIMEFEAPLPKVF